jgi:hypothetical protein
MACRNDDRRNRPGEGGAVAVACPSRYAGNESPTAASCRRAVTLSQRREEVLSIVLTLLLERRPAAAAEIGA